MTTTPPGPPPSRTAVVTGASRGIGRALAAGLARAGLDVALTGRDADALRDAADEARAAGAGRVVAVTAEATDPGDVERALDRVRTELGRPDLLVNCAGVIESEEVPVWEADVEDWWRVVEANVRGPFLFYRSVVPDMLAAGGGRVIDLSSGAAIRDSPVYSAYNASKAALFRLGGAAHEAGRSRGLRTFQMSPGVVRTAMTAAMPAHSGRSEWTDPADVVALAVAIASGDLDAWSGRYVRAGTDGLADLRARTPGPRGRSLGLVAWQGAGSDDPAVPSE